MSVVIFSILQIRKLSHTGIHLHKIISQRQTLTLFNSKAIWHPIFFQVVSTYFTKSDIAISICLYGRSEANENESLLSMAP